MSAEIKRRRSRKKKWRRFEDGDLHRGTYIVPNLFTTANLFSGFFGIVSSINGNFQMAALAILMSVVFDILDGKVARFTGGTSRFGIEYDSLADLVSFGVGPGLMLYLWALRPFGRIGWLAAFLFVACGALRLARFNVQVDVVSKKYFVGLPIPGAASMLATTVLFFLDWRVAPSPITSIALLVATYVLGLLMVSTVPFNSFKDLEMVRAKPLPILVGVIVLLTIIAVAPELMLFTLMLAYLISGPLGYLFRKFKGAPPEQETMEQTPLQQAPLEPEPIPEERADSDDLPRS